MEEETFSQTSLSHEKQVEAKFYDLVDSALLFGVSFLLFSVLMKPLVKAVRQRIWSSRTLQSGALLAVLLLWWRRRAWVRTHLPWARNMEDHLALIMSHCIINLGETTCYAGITGLTVGVGYAWWRLEDFVNGTQKESFGKHNAKRPHEGARASIDEEMLTNVEKLFNILQQRTQEVEAACKGETIALPSAVILDERESKIAPPRLAAIGVPCNPTGMLPAAVSLAHLPLSKSTRTADPGPCESYATTHGTMQHHHSQDHHSVPYQDQPYLEGSPPPYCEDENVLSACQSEGKGALQKGPVRTSDQLSSVGHSNPESVFCCPREDIMPKENDVAVIKKDESSEHDDNQNLVFVTSSKFHRISCRYAKQGGRRVPRHMAMEVLCCVPCKICMP